MSEAKHTPEPWRIVPHDSGEAVIGMESGFDLVGANDEVAADDGSAWGEYSREMSEANARRIVSCVNACAGIPTEDLERGYVQVKQGNVPHTHAPFFCPRCGNAHDASIMCRGPYEVESCPHCGATPYLREAAPIGPGIASEYRAVCARCKQ